MKSEREDQGLLRRVTLPRGLALYPTHEAALVAHAAVDIDLLGEVPEPWAPMLVLPHGAVVLEVGRRGSFLLLHTELGPGWLYARTTGDVLEAVEEVAQ